MLITNWQRQKTSASDRPATFSLTTSFPHLCTGLSEVKTGKPHSSQNHDKNLTSRKTHLSSCFISILNNPSFIWWKGGNLCIRSGAICNSEDREIAVLVMDISERQNIGWNIWSLLVTHGGNLICIKTILV